MHLRWHYMEDERGNKFKPCTIRQAVKGSGVERGAFVKSEDAGKFWSTFFLAGSIFTILMQPMNLLTGALDWDMLFTPLWFMTTAFMFVCYGFFMGLFIKLMAWNSAEHAKHAVLSIGHCPSCTYRLFDIEEETDGCTVCPECGGVWKINDSA